MVIIRLTIARNLRMKRGRRSLGSPFLARPADGRVDKSIFDGDVDVADIETFRRVGRSVIAPPTLNWRPERPSWSGDGGRTVRREGQVVPCRW